MFLSWLARRSRPFVATTSLGGVVLSSYIDRITGPEVRFFIFYWPVIALAAWFLGLAWGSVLVAAASVAWVAANTGNPGAESPATIVAWNANVNFASFALLAWLISRLRSMLNRERLTQRTDYLTGVANSRAFAELLQKAAARSQRDGVPLTLADIDVDDFKTINDRLGHSTGDLALQKLAQTIQSVLRAPDSVDRLGGDEFAVLLPDATQEAAAAVLQRLRHEFAAFAAANNWPLTVSIGAITCRTVACGADDLIHRADTLMYEVKSEGKDGVRIADFSVAP